MRSAPDSRAHSAPRRGPLPTSSLGLCRALPLPGRLPSHPPHGQHLPERPSLALVSRILPAPPCAPWDKATFSQTIPAGPCALCGVRAPWGQGPHPLSSLRVGWGEDTWEVCSEKRVVLAGLWDEDIFISSLYFIHKPIPVFITYYLYNLVKKTNNKKGTQKMHF